MVTEKDTLKEFLNTMAAASALKETENGATALSTTLSSLLDLFGTIGSLRSRREEDITLLFAKAYAEDPLLALKTLFYARDIRGGLGERRTFRIILKYLAINHPEVVVANIANIATYGRYDDYYCLVDTPVEKEAFRFLLSQYRQDQEYLKSGQISKISLLAKWLKSANTSSAESRALAHKTYTAFGENASTYRRSLSALRSAIKLVERDMSSYHWDSIDYPAVPSKAMLRYSKSFLVHDSERYAAYLKALKSGKEKVNASTLYPYDLVREYNRYRPEKDDIVEEQWKALPDYLSPNDRFLIMADTSGSMEGTFGVKGNVKPIHVSVGLATYFADHSTGPFAHKFITFTDHPRLVDIPPSLSLLEKTRIVLDYRYVGYDTNLEAAFELVLNSAIKSHLPQEDLPTAIVVISDMEINCFGSMDDNTTFTEEMSRRFSAAGYTMPTLVYWNVAARNNTYHATASDDVRFVSGASASVFKSLCESLGSTPMELLLNTLSDPRYDLVNLPTTAC